MNDKDMSKEKGFIDSFVGMLTDEQIKAFNKGISYIDNLLSGSKKPKESKVPIVEKKEVTDNNDELLIIVLLIFLVVSIRRKKF